MIGLENPQSEIGSTLNPQIRFFVFDAEPNMDRLDPAGARRAAAAAAGAADGVARSSIACSGTRSAGRRPRPSGRSPKTRLRDPAGSGPAVRAGARRSAVGGDDEAGVSVDLLSDGRIARPSRTSCATIGASA